MQQLISTKANKSDLLLIKKRISEESNVTEQLEALQAFVDGKLSREDAEAMRARRVLILLARLSHSDRTLTH